MTGLVRPSVGFIGLGRMGMPMAKNLVRAGFHLVVHSRSQGPVDELIAAGATPAAYPAEVAALSDAVCTCLPDIAASEQVYLGDDGLVAAVLPNNVLIETSTISPALARRVAAATKAKGGGYVDAPVSGGVERAIDGSLTIMAGGDAGDLERAMPVLEGFGASVHHVGEVGLGSVVKLINQLLVGVHTQAACEAIALGTKAGADPAQIMAVLGSSWGSSGMLTRTAPIVASGDYGSRAPMRLIAKDLGLVAELAAEVGLDLPVTRRTHDAVEAAVGQGLAETDIAALYTLLVK